MPGPEVTALLFAILIVGILALLAAVWFGLFVLAPRIGRMLDRAEADADAEDPRDRSD